MGRTKQDTAGSIFRRNWRLILFVLGIVIAFWLVYTLRSVLLPFICGLVLAYLLYPIVSWLERKLPVKGRWLSTRRASLVAGLFIIILVIVGIFVFYIATGVIGSFSSLIKNAPQYFSEGLQTLRGWLDSFQRWLPPELQQQFGGSFHDAGTTLGNAMRNAFGKGISYISGTFGFILGFVALPVFLFYILKDWEKLSSGFYSAFSPQMARHVRGFVAVIDKVLGRWIRAQLMLSVTVAVLCFIGLAALGITLAPALAVLQGIMEFVPILGPWIGGAVGVIVILAIAPQKVIWAIIIYLAVQLLENIFLVPRIHGSYLHIHPALILVLLTLGAFIAGLWGIILIVPLTATIVEIYKYVRDNMKVDEGQQTA
ncbi:MAG: AI-2E family transporter [Chloroflexi bacterium]|nr:AI-2E family transporter [Chloroflexota bacterium]MBL7062228.1 AI-2E family transporter [Dehalococcoidia bacterium]